MDEEVAGGSTKDRNRGATAVEYGLLVALIAGLILAGVAALGNGVLNSYQKTENEMTNAGM
jgi:pilus assembly protein Flp/PilA